MPKRVVTLPREPGLLDLDFVSHGRGRPRAATTLSQEQIQQVMRTVRRTPEVVVKVSGGGRDVGAVKAHFAYIDRHGKQAIVTDDGRELTGKGAAAEIVGDWNLDLACGKFVHRAGAQDKDLRPKLVHNIVLSMPGRTAPELVLRAAQKFARENFALQHRYAMVLHTDQKHPHVHLVVKAEHEFEPGKRLSIKKATLRQWREQFAACLRELGVPANATSSTARGRPRSNKKDPIHHRLAAVRAFNALAPEQKTRRTPPAESSFMRRKVEGVARDLQAGRWSLEPAKAKLAATREVVEQGWAEVAHQLRSQGEVNLAQEVHAFVESLPQVRTDRERIAEGLLATLRAQRSREAPADPSRPKSRESKTRE